MRLTKINSTTVYGFRFGSLDLARSFAFRCLKPHRLILGDHPCFWVVCPADAERLVRTGYEYAE